MRFHCGISFSWRTIKKFLIPILIGILTAFGFGYFGIINANALENYDTKFDYNYSDLSDYESYVLDNNNVTFTDFFNHIKAIDTAIYDYTISINITHSTRNGVTTYKISYIDFYIFDSSVNYTFNIFGGTSNRLLYKFTKNSNFNNWYVSINTRNLYNDIYNDSNYVSFYSCVTGGTCPNNSSFSSEANLGWTEDSTTLDNNSNNINSVSSNSGIFVLYYSTKDLIINNTYNYDDSNTFYKSLYVNDNSIEVSSKFPTYIDYLSFEPEPDPSPEPEPSPDPIPDDINHKAIFNKVYWFDDNTTTEGILSSIYILLFLYCITMIFLRIIYSLKNKRW